MPTEPLSLPLYSGGPPQAERVFLQNLGASQSFVNTAAWEESAQTSTTNWLERTLRQSSIGSDQDSPLLSAGDARARLQTEGVQFDIPDSGMREATFTSMVSREFDKRAHADAIERGPQGFIAGTERFGIGLARQAIDPLNLASAFIPVVGEVRMAGMLARAGASQAARLGVYARVGVLEGAVGNLALEPAMHYFASHLQEDYTVADSLLNTAFGGIIGGGLHMGVGTIRDWRASTGIAADVPLNVHEIPARGEIPERVASLSPEARADIGRMALAQAIDGRDIDIAAALDLASITEKATSQERTPGFLQTAEDLLSQRAEARLRETPGFLQGAVDKLALRELDTERAATETRIQERVSGESQMQIANIEEARQLELAQQLHAQSADVTARNLADLMEAQQTRAELLLDTSRMKSAAKDRDLTVKDLRKKVERMQRAGVRDLATYQQAGIPVDRLTQIQSQRRAAEGVHQTAKNGQAPEAGIPPEAMKAIEEADQILKEHPTTEGEAGSAEVRTAVQDAVQELDALLKAKASKSDAATLFASEDAAITQAADDTKIMTALAQCRLRNG